MWGVDCEGGFVVGEGGVGDVVGGEGEVGVAGDGDAGGVVVDVDVEGGRVFEQVRTILREETSIFSIMLQLEYT